MASIRSLLNAPAPKRPHSLSSCSDPELSTHYSNITEDADSDADAEYESDPEPATYDRAEAIAYSVARSMNATPTQASMNRTTYTNTDSKHANKNNSVGERFDTPPLRLTSTTNIRPLPLREHDALTNELVSPQTQSPSSQHEAPHKANPKAKPKRLLESPVTSTVDIHYHRFVWPQPSPRGASSRSPQNSPSRSPTPSPSSSVPGSTETHALGHFRAHSNDYTHSDTDAYSATPSPSAVLSRANTPSPQESRGTPSPSHLHSHLKSNSNSPTPTSLCSPSPTTSTGTNESVVLGVDVGVGVSGRSGVLPSPRKKLKLNITSHPQTHTHGQGYGQGRAQVQGHGQGHAHTHTHTQPSPHGSEYKSGYHSKNGGGKDAKKNGANYGPGQGHRNVNGYTGLDAHPGVGTTGKSKGKEKDKERKTRVVKDAPVYVEGPTRGEVRYSVKAYGEGVLVETDDTSAPLRDYHNTFQMFPPQEDIHRYPRCIPYNSERRVFADKTGRDFFEVFQYEFSVPGQGDKTFVMLWDYNIGLVRTTPLFKCCGYGKTTPAKMLNKNVGLREICHSITGGALVAQGYWIPYDAAKAVAATFCFSIRYALTPVFGMDFIDMCVPPDDTQRFGSMMIDPEITRVCTQQMRSYYNLEMAHPSPRVGATISPGVGFRSPKLGVARPVAKKDFGLTSGKEWKAVNRVQAVKGSSESEYETESGDDDLYALSTTLSSPGGLQFKNVWTTPPTSSKRAAFFEDEMISPKTKMMPYGIRKRVEEVEEDDYEVKYVGSHKRGSPKTKAMQGLGLRKMDFDEEYDEMEVDDSGVKRGDTSLRYHGNVANRGGREDFGELDAAKTLMDLKTSVWGVRKVADRRASY